MAIKKKKKLAISIGQSRKSKLWPKSEILWSDFLKKLEVPQRTDETYAEYMKYSKSKQDELKDVGGFVGGTFLNNRRKNEFLQGKDLITLDLDNVPTDGTKDVLKKVTGLGCSYAVYSTRKHSTMTPRLRVLLPLIETVDADKYEHIERKIASLIGIEYADPTTFEPTRFMYWPSCSSDGEYIFKSFDGPFVDGEKILSMYENWTDISTWPEVPGSEVRTKRMLAKQEDPTTKKGIIGAFCNIYDIYGALETFIPGMYEATVLNERFTYLGGSTSGGAVIYESGKFMYSHHATDPISGLLVNSFDLIRIHKFGSLDLDAKDGTPVNKLPSFLEMSKLARSDKQVSTLVNKDRLDKVKEAFDEDIEEEINTDWMNLLDLNINSGKIEKTIDNIVIILENDSSIKGKIALDEFANRGLVLGSLPWNSETEVREWSEIDDAEVTRYLEKGFEITGREKIEKALLIVSNRNKINEVKTYLESLVWDGKPRIKTLLYDYLGADKNIYTEAVMKKSLAAAVARGINGTTKYDYMVILAGAQGIGKSTFLAKLGKKWFSDSLQCFEGKEAAEMIQGTWINELGELTGMTRSETNAVKQFLSKQDDIYREAYGRRTNKYPRRCVFYGTTNDGEFLKDATGNRRFWPVDVGLFTPVKSIFDDLDTEVDQIWAEAVVLWKLGEPLYLTGKAKELSEQQQEKHRESNAKEGVIQDYVDMLVPDNWDNISLQNRKLYLNGNFKIDGQELVVRDKICALEIWCECFNGDLKYMKRKDSVEINNILANLKGWVKNKSVRRFGYCGRQRGFERVDNMNLNEYISNNSRAQSQK